MSNFVKFAALGFLVLQNASVVLVMRYSFVNQKPGEARYHPPVAVFAQELVKFLLSMLFLLVEKKYEWRPTVSALRQSLNTWDMANISVPAFLYVLQNNLLYVASANMSPAPLQLMMQLKIFTTAVLSVLILGKKLSWRHWGSLVGLFVGICVVQMSVQVEAKSSSSSAADDGTQSPLLGLGAVSIAVTCSGLAGVWFEKILKKKEVSLWTSNFQLALISIAIALGSIAVNPPPPSSSEADAGWFAGFNNIVWGAVALQSLGGLLIAVVVKYTDNIIKGYATSIATVVGTIGSVLWFDFHVSSLFVLGSLAVLSSAYVYGAAEMPRQTSASSTPEPLSPQAAKQEDDEEEEERLTASKEADKV